VYINVLARAIVWPQPVVTFSNRFRKRRGIAVS